MYSASLEQRLDKQEIPFVSFDPAGSATTPGLSGLARFDLAQEDLRFLKSLHELIKERLGRNMNGWGGIRDMSGRRRGYGYFPSTLGEGHFEVGIGSMKEYNGADTVADSQANARASVMLTLEEVEEEASKDGPDLSQWRRTQRQGEGSLRDVINRLGSSLQACIPPQYAPYLSFENLVAAQPNIHGGNGYLPPHLDEPLHDGFGIVIMTVAVRGDAHIILQTDSWDSEKKADHCFRLAEEQGYLLSGDSRNKVLHGVLSDENSCHRESLNLRFP